MDRKDNETGTDKLRFINPPGLYDPRPNGYSHLSLFPKGWRIILPAGQGGETEDQFLSEDFATQLKQAVRNTITVLRPPAPKCPTWRSSLYTSWITIRRNSGS